MEEGENIGAPISATDQDSDNILTYTDDSSEFNVDGQTGQLQIASGVSLDYEGGLISYTVAVTATDNGSPRRGTATITVTVNVTDVNEAPTFDRSVTGVNIPTATDLEVQENTVAGTNIGSTAFQAVDQDGDELTYSVSGSDFAIDPETGQLKTKAPLDYEMTRNYEVMVTATDPNGLTAVATVTINIADDTTETAPTNSAPYFSTPTGSATIAESTAAGGTVETFTATDDAPLQTVTYALEGTDKDAFAIDASTGAITINDAPDYETKSSYMVTVVATDDQAPPLSGRIRVTITVTNIEENPVFSEDSPTRTVAENTVAGVNIGAPVSATDPEGKELTYSETSDVFDIDSETGQLKTMGPLNHETLDSYTVEVTATAAEGGGSSQVSVPITVTDANDPPVFGTIPTSLEIDENTAAGENIGNILPVLDEDEDDLTYSLGGPDGSSFDFEKMVSATPDENGVQLQTKAALDYETKEDYEVTIIVTDGNGGQATAEVIITVTDESDATPANSAPRFGAVSQSYILAENATTNVADGVVNSTMDDLAATDANSDDTVRYTLGGPDAALFKFDSANTQLQIRAPLDFDTKSVYMVTVTATDKGGLTDTIRVTITLTNANEAPMFPDETTTFEPVAEDTAAGVVIGTVPMATDPDEDDTEDTLIYSVANDMGFAFDPDTRQLKTRSLLNHEFRAKHEVTITVTDGGSLTDTITVIINVTDVNEAPMFADDTVTFTVVEGTAAGEAIGSPVKATDPDDGDTLTYTHGGPDMSSFAIESTTDGGQLKTRAALDYETKTDYEVTIIVTDRDGLTAEITVTIRVDNDQSDDSDVTNRPPVFSLGRSKSYEREENTAVGELLGTIRATDRDRGQTVTYTLGGTDSASFEFDATLEQLKTKVALDYEVKPSHTATITASDSNGGSDVIDIVLTVLNVNEAPTFDSGQDTAHAVDENTAAGMTVGGTYPATDPEDDNLTYSIGGPDSGFFAIDEETGQLKTKAALDHEAAATRKVTVMVEDGGSLTDELSVTITIGDVNEAPAFPADAATALMVDENTAAATDITDGTYVATDPDDGDTDTLIYTLGGPDGGSFASVDLTDGGIKLQTKDALDYETKEDYEVMITVSDGSLMDSVTVVITVDDDGNEADEATTNTAPQFDRLRDIRSVDENTGAGENIGAVLAASDEDNHDLTYTLGGDDMGSFAIEKMTSNSPAQNGVQLKTKAALDYENDPKTTYMVTITVSDGVLEDSIRVTINVMDVNETPVFDDDVDTTPSIQENVGKGTTIETVSATDPDGGNLNYSLEGRDASAFDIDVETGRLETSAELDHETNATYTVTVVASDGALEARITVTITIGDENDPPMFTDDQVTRTVQENTEPDMDVSGGPVTAVDPDGDTLTYSVSGTVFGIDSETGVLKTTSAALNYEGKRNYEVTVTATDPDTDSDTVRVVINVTNDETDDDPAVNSAPYFDATRTEFSIIETAGPGDSIGTKITATDDDTDDVLTYTLGGADARSFDHEADGTGLQLQVKEGVLDYETETDYEVMVTVRDPSNLSDSIIVIIKVDDDETDEAPEANRKPYFRSTSTTRTVDAGTLVRDILPEVRATDPDPEDEEALEYSITGGPDRNRFYHRERIREVEDYWSTYGR